MYKEKIHAYKVFAEDLSKAKLKNVMLIHGEEEYLIKWAVDSVINKYVSSATKQMNISVFDETEMSSTDLVSAVCEACETLPLFFGQKGDCRKGNEGAFIRFIAGDKGCRPSAFVLIYREASR